MKTDRLINCNDMAKNLVGKRLKDEDLFLFPDGVIESAVMSLNAAAFIVNGLLIYSFKDAEAILGATEGGH